MESATPDIVQKQANAAVSRALLEFAGARSNGRRFHRESIGRDVDPEWCFGDFLLLVADDNESKIEKRYGAYKTKAALSATGGGTTGGYLVPEELRDDLMADVAAEAIFRPRCLVIPTNTITLDLPYWDATVSVSAGQAPFWGGMQMSWTGEAKQPTESEPKFKQLSLAMYELGGTLLVSEPLMQDARGLEAWLRIAFARSLAWYEDYSVINGNGVGKMQGLLNSGCALNVTRTGSSPAYVTADGQAMFKKFYNRLSGRPRSVALWLFSVTDSDLLTQQANWFVNGPVEQYGIPVARTLLQPAVGSKGDVIAVDPSLYVIGDRQALEIAASKYTDGTTYKQNQWMWRVIERIGGSPWLSGPINVPDGGSNQVSPIVVLQ